MAAIMAVNPKAELARAAEALTINVVAANSLAEFVKSNLGPKGTLKMLVGGAGDIKLTKDGKVLLSEVQVKHPTASIICRAATAQDDITGDGTTTIVMLIGELLRHAHASVIEGLHPRIIIDAYTASRERATEALDKIAVKFPASASAASSKKSGGGDAAAAQERNLLVQVAYTSLRTKVKSDVAAQMADIVTDAVLSIREDGNNKAIDLHMVEIMEMPHKLESDSKLIRGLVLDHGARHPDMPKNVKNAFILTCNVSLEYEKTEVNSGYFYSDPAEREKMVAAEREFIVDRCRKIIALKQQVCKGDKADYGFVVINQKGIDPHSLDMLSRENIMALRRAKRRNMERLVLACGGSAVNSVEELSPDVLGYAGKVYEYTLGEDKFTFVEDCRNPKSCTILLKGPNKHTQLQLKDALRDGLRAVLNALEDGRVVPGAGAAEIAMHEALMQLKEETKGKQQLGIQAFADAILCVPKTLAQNSGFDQQEVLVKLQHEYKKSKQPVGLDIDSGEPCLPAELGIWDNYLVKKQILHSAVSIATNLLLVDEIMRAGMTSLKPGS